MIDQDHEINAQADEDSDEEEGAGNESDEEEDNNQREYNSGGKDGAGFWNRLTNGVINSFNFLRTRAGRAGVVRSFLRGLQLSNEGWLTDFSLVHTARLSRVSVYTRTETISRLLKTKKITTRIQICPVNLQ